MLRDSLAAVAEHARRLLVADPSAMAAEDIHQLRVTARRAAAALALLTPVLPKRLVARTGRRLRKLRRAAGPARDADVLLEACSHWSDTAAQPAIAYLVDEQTRARQALRRFLKRTRRRRYWSWWRRQLRHLRGETARPRRLALQPLLTAVEQALRWPEPTASWDALHAQRIAGKRLRYGLTALAEWPDLAIDPAWLEFLKDWQDRFGRHLDGWRWAERLHFLLEKVDDPKTQAFLNEQVQNLTSRPEAAIEDLRAAWQLHHGTEIRRQIAVFLAELEA
jgi:CHAD domain-containing protein